MEINTDNINNTTNVEIEEPSMNIMESLNETNTTETVKELSLDIENDAGDKNNISGGLCDGSIIQERIGIDDFSVENVSENDMDSPVKKSGASLQRFCDSDTSEDEVEDVRKMSELNEEPANSEVGNTKSDYDIMKSRLKALCDSDSSEDEREPLIQSDAIYAEKDLISKSKSSVKKSDKPKERNMTAKEYEEQKLEIKSESQRMQRERNISLPYHRSKPRSLKEFLEKRPKFTAALSDKGQKASPILAIKMTNQNLERISLKLEEREKMLEIFYKSESENEDENNEENAKIDKDEPTNVPNNCDDAQINENERINTKKNSEENITTNLYEEIIPTQIFENAKQTAGIIEILSEVIIPKNSEEQSTMNNTTDYEFSLDNADLSENISDSINAEENTTFNVSVISQPKTGLNRMQLLREALGNSAPKLSGDPNEIINLHEDVQTPKNDSSGIDNLIERFIKHSTRKNRPKDDSVQIDILTISNGELRNEKATMQLYNDSADEPVAVLETPGAKLKKLRTNLQLQMAQRRAEMWKQKNVLMENMNSNGGGGTKEGYEDGEYDLLLDDEEEDEFDVEEEEDEEELEENDVDMTEKKKEAKSAFIDEEAEISETEDVVVSNDEDHDGDDEEENDIETNNFDSTDEINSTKKKLKRIIVMDDSDDENNLLTLNNDAPKDKSICKGPLDSTDPWEDEDDSESQLPPNAQRPPSRQRTPQLTRTKSSTVLGLITPVRQLTALQSFESAPNEDLDQSQQTQGVPHPSPVLPLPPDPSPLKGNMWQRHLLFPECDSATNGETMVNMEELANEICSGKFPSSISYDLITNDNDKNVIKPSLETEISSQPSTQDILDICSWNFTCATENVNCNYEKKEFETNSHQNNFDKDQSTSKVQLMQKNKLDLNKKDFEPFLTLESLNDDDDKVISQLLDEEEMEKFKKKFESPLNIDEKAEVQPKSPICCRIMFDTSDEDEIDNNAIMGKIKKIRKKKQKKCLIEDSDEDEVDNAHIGGGDDFISAVATLENRENVDYDSEENEIDKTESRPVLRVDEFFENEAELTESDWDSADEDEKGLDELDIEVGDEEQFDEEKLRSGIERVQLRQMLDEDNKDLKILQEILLEDGELHGTGRERQFRWRNIDNTFDLESGASKQNDEEQLEDCSESEEMWRKKRHERVQFLRSKKASEQEVSNDFIIASNSILKLGEKAIVRNASVLQNSEATAEEVKIKQQDISLIVKQPFALINKRGSFLSRGEKALAKVAEFTKLQKGVTTGPTKFSRKFLFSTVLNDSESDHAKKRKADDGTPIAIKKLRLDGLSPARFSSVSGKTSAKNLFKTT